MIACSLLASQMGMAVGYAYQIGVPVSNVVSNGVSANDGFILTYASMVFVFYVVAVYFSFIAYREFKAMMEDSQGMRGVSLRNPMNYGSVKSEV